MVDLNLKPAEKKKVVSAKSYQTLEQARMQAPKDKVAVLPPPPAPMPMVAPGTYYGTNTMAAPGGYYPQQQPQQPHMYNTVGAGAYGMAGAFGGQPSGHSSAITAYGGNFSATPPQQFHQGFPPAKPNVFGSDPFATLS